MIKNIKFAGHSAIFLETSKQVIAIDPWLEGNPLTPNDLKNPSKLDLIVLSHGHADHAGDTVRLQKNTDCFVAATYELAMILIHEGIPSDKVIPMNKGGTVNHNGVFVTLTHAYHSSSYDSPSKGTLYAGEACSVVIKEDNTTIFHAGDTEVFADLELIGNLYQPQLAFLPIGDRFTMNSIGAATAAKMLGVKRVIPIHYKTFPILEQSAEQFAYLCSKDDIEVIELNPGQIYSCNF
jgi:L-ascorbate metabolism protein UlaG (beta-lactamase superfamily)